MVGVRAFGGGVCKATRGAPAWHYNAGRNSPVLRYVAHIRVSSLVVTGSGGKHTRSHTRRQRRTALKAGEGNEADPDPTSPLAAKSDEPAGSSKPGNYGNRFSAARSTRQGLASDAAQAEAQLEKDISTGLASALESTNPMQLVGLSMCFYGAMTLAAISLGESNGHMQIYKELLTGWDIAGGLLFLSPLLLGLTLAVEKADSVASLAQMRDSYEKTLVPLLERVPSWGHALLALGAAVGEETFFRYVPQVLPERC